MFFSSLYNIILKGVGEFSFKSIELREKKRKKTYQYFTAANGDQENELCSKLHSVGMNNKVSY